MVTSDLLLLLLMLGSFHICIQGDPQASTDQEHHFLLKRGNKQVQQGLKDAKAFLKQIEPLIALIPSAGKYLSASIKVLTGGSDGDKLINEMKSHFKNLHEQLDKQLVTMTWNTWASGPYREAESNIRLAWKNFDGLLDDCGTPCFIPQNKEKNLRLITDLYNSLVFSPDKLYLLVTTKQPSFITDFKTLLADHHRCHEKSIIDFTGMVSELMVMSSIINIYYYKIHRVDRAEEIADMTFEMFSAMSEIHRFCIENPEKYIIKDIFDMIDENQDRQQLAKDIKEFLNEAYSRYDWMVVAFITRHSKYSMFYNRFLNRHYLDGVTEVTKGEVSVAVAKQISGSYTKAQEIKTSIKNCFSENDDCSKVIKELKSCPGIGNFYTAVHAYGSKSHDSTEEDQDEFIDEEGPSPPQYIYTGECKKYKIIKGGHFRVMIRSDEDLNDVDPCKDVKCGEGQCLNLKKIKKAVCVCNKGYTGSNCGISKEDFKNAIKAWIPNV